MRPHQIGQGIRRSQVAAVIGGVLGDQDDLLCALRHQVSRFGDESRRRPAAKLAFERRDRAESARCIAAVADLQISAARNHRRAEHCIGQGLFGIAEQCIAPERALAGAAPQPLDKGDDLHPAPRAQQAVDLRHFPDDPLAVPLGHAASGNQELARPFASGQFFQGCQRFVFCCGQESTRVDEQDVRFVWHGRAAIAGAAEQHRHTFAIDTVLGTTQG